MSTPTPTPATTTAPRPKVWKATDLDKSRPLLWLAKGRIPAGVVTYMVGPEGIGKSLFLVWLTALVTTGRPFLAFGIPAGPPRVVVLVLTEDDWSTIARPRLELAGADLNMVRVICAEQDGSGSPLFPDDMTTATQAATGAALVIVDAWADTLPAGLSVRDPQQGRQALHPWKELATRTGVSVLLSGHTNREKGGNVRNAYGLTGTLRQKVRMTLLAQPDPDEDQVFTIGPEKENVGPPLPASRFRIEAKQVFAPTDHSDGTVPLLTWIGDADQSAKDMYADNAAAAEGESGDSAGIDQWLTELLTAGPVKSTEVYTAADANGYSKDQAKRAKRRLSLEAKKSDLGWSWSLPEGSREQGLSPRSLAPLLPSRSEGVTKGAETPREQGSRVQEIHPDRCSICDGPGPLSTYARDCDRCRAGKMAGTKCSDCGHPRQISTTGRCGACIADQVPA